MTKKKKITIAAVCFAAILIITLVAIASCRGTGKAPGGDTTAATGAANVPGTTDALGTADASETTDVSGTTNVPDHTTDAEPEASSAAPEVSSAAPEVSGTTPETSGATPEVSGAEPENSGATPETSAATPETSGATPETSGATPEVSGTEPETSAEAPETSAEAPETSAEAPETTTGNEPVHYHSFSSWSVTRPATCGAAGEEARSCTQCGKQETRSTAQLTHSYGDWSVTRTATCSTAGEESRTCANCGKQETRSTAQLTHSYGGWATTHPATCAAAGEEARSCTNCGKQETRSTAQLTHSYGAWTVTRTATCSTAGEETRSCTNCGAEETRSTELSGHTFTVTKNVDNDPFSDTFGSNGIETCPGCGATQEIPYADPDYRTDEFLRLLEQRVLYWINQYRAEEGVAPAQMLPRMWEYAQVRATYLINNFAHDPHDERAAATQIQYGAYTTHTVDRYVKSTGMTAEEVIQFFSSHGYVCTESTIEFYAPSCGEAIGNAFLTFENINVFAQRFATACRNSTPHWNYVGIRKYETVGIARDNKMFYLVICTRDEIKYED